MVIAEMFTPLDLRPNRAVSPYVAEEVFRYNNRATEDKPLGDADRFALAVPQILGKRLTYAELTGKVEGTSEEKF